MTIHRNSIVFKSESEAPASVTTTNEGLLEGVTGRPLQRFTELNGLIDKIKIDYYNAKPETRVDCFTSDGEKVFSVEGNKKGILRPRASTQSSLSAHITEGERELFSEDSFLRFLAFNAGEGAIINIEVVYRA